MMKVINLNEINNIENFALMEYILNKTTAMMKEYHVESLDDICCFVVLNEDEFTEFPMNEMEFVEVLEIGNKSYLHGVKILGDSYGEDIFLSVEVIEC